MHAVRIDRMRMYTRRKKHNTDLRFPRVNWAALPLSDDAKMLLGNAESILAFTEMKSSARYHGLG